LLLLLRLLQSLPSGIFMGALALAEACTPYSCVTSCSFLYVRIARLVGK